MSIVNEATRVVTGAARMTTSAVGAVGGGVVGGVSGGIRGAAGGVRDGIRSGAKSTPTAVLTLAAVGAVGLVEWPVLVAVGGTAVVLRELDRKDHAADGAGTSKHEQHPRKSEKPAARTSHKSQSAS